jgi:UDP-glucose 4-epimerase
MRRVAITGVSGYVGSLLANRLAEHPEVVAIIGLDLRAPAESPAKLRFHQRDVTQPFDDVFQSESVDAAVHLAFIVKPTHHVERARAVNLDGSRNLVAACLASGTNHLVYFGSATAYGAHPDNPVPLTEEAPLRPNKGFQYARDKAETDLMLQEAASLNPDLEVAILRGCVVLGPKGEGAIGGKVFQPVMLRIAGHDPLVQYLHEEDVVDAIVSQLERPETGIYNLGGDGPLRYSQVAHLAKRLMIALPRSIIGSLIDATWTLRLQSESTSAGLDFISYPWVVSNEKLKSAIGFTYRFSTEDAVLAYLRRQTIPVDYGTRRSSADRR